MARPTFNMTEVDNAVTSGTIDHTNPVFRIGTKENNLARRQARDDRITDNTTADQERKDMRDDAEDRYFARIAVLGGKLSSGGEDTGGATVL